MELLSIGARIEIAERLVPDFIYGRAYDVIFVTCSLFTDLMDFVVNSVKVHGYIAQKSTEARESKTPCEENHSEKPDQSKLKKFTCTAFKHLESYRDKFRVKTT